MDRDSDRGDVSVEEADVRKVRRWDASDQRASRIFGDQWYDEQRSTVLIVPSTVTRVERNVVINQAASRVSEASGHSSQAGNMGRTII